MERLACVGFLVFSKKVKNLTKIEKMISKVLAKGRKSVIEDAKVIFSRWFQDETDVPNNKRMIPCLFVMRSMFLFLSPKRAQKSACGISIANTACFWIHRCSHKL